MGIRQGQKTFDDLLAALPDSPKNIYGIDLDSIRMIFEPTYLALFSGLAGLDIYQIDSHDSEGIQHFADAGAKYIAQLRYQAE